MAEGKLDLIFWGYVSNVLLSLLKPYKQGTLLELTNEDKEIIKKSEGFLDAILVGCKTVEEPHMLSFRNSSREVPSATALGLAIEIFSTMLIPAPNNLGEFKKKLNNYRKLLEKLRASKSILPEDSGLVDEVSRFFKGLGNKADQVGYESTYSL